MQVLRSPLFSYNLAAGRPRAVTSIRVFRMAGKPNEASCHAGRRKVDTILLQRRAVNGCVVVPSGWCKMQGQTCATTFSSFSLPGSGN